MILWILAAAIGGSAGFAFLGLAIARATPSAYAVAPLAAARNLRLSAGTIRYHSDGNGPATTLLLHGFNGELANWDEVWPLLPARGCAGRRIRLDIPGYGGSSWSTDDYGLPAQGARVMEFLDSLGVTEVTLVGTSMGGSLAAWIAATQPRRVRQLLLLAPSGYPGSLTYSGLFGRLVKPGPLNRIATWIARSRPYRVAFPRSRALQALTVTASYGQPWVEALGRIEAPTVLAWSGGDRTVTADAAARVAAAIPRSALVMLPDSTGHGIPGSSPGFVARTACRLAAGEAPRLIADAP